MRTYEETIERAGRRIYQSYMDGDYNYHNVVDSEEIAFIFAKAVAEVKTDSMEAFKRILFRPLTLETAE